MKKVMLRMNEQQKFDVIKKLVDNNGSKYKAATQLNCTIRTINRLIFRYKTKGKSGFIHGNRGITPNNKLSLERVEFILERYTHQYQGANIKHLCELLKENDALILSDTSIRTLLYRHDILSPKAHKKTVKALKKSLHERKRASPLKKEQVRLERKLDSIEPTLAHPRRPRCAYRGEMVQMDASEYFWFGDVKSHLHLAIDDASGAVVGAYFDTQETLQGYYHTLSHILTNFGIPARFLTDRRTVFEYKRKQAPLDTEDTFTQFSYACKQLGIEVDTTSVPQAKGRVERLNQTLQSRLPIELRLAGVSCIEDANLFLISYLQKFNEQFSIPLNHTKSVFETQPTEEQRNQILSIISKRVVDSAHCIKYKKNYYLPIDEDRAHRYFSKGTPALVVEAFDKQLFVNIKDHLFALEMIPDRQAYSKEFDNRPTEPKKKKVFIPPLSHPWKQGAYNSFLEKQSYKNNRKSA